MAGRELSTILASSSLAMTGEEPTARNARLDEEPLGLRLRPLAKLFAARCPAAATLIGRSRARLCVPSSAARLVASARGPFCLSRTRPRTQHLVSSREARRAAARRFVCQT